MKKSKIKVSVIVATYNCVNSIEKTIKSFIAQNYSEKELIIIDGGSTDETQNIIKKYKNNISFWVSEPDKGISDAFNKGIKHSTGDFIYFLGAGDYFWKNNVLKLMMTDVDPENNSIVCGRINRISQNNNKIIYASEIDFQKWHLLYKMSLPHQGLFMNIKYFNKYGLFDTNLVYAMDYEILLRAYGEFPTVVMKDIVVAAWIEGGVGTNKIDKVLDEYKIIKIKNHVAPTIIVNIIDMIIRIRYSLFK